MPIHFFIGCVRPLAIKFGDGLDGALSDGLDFIKLKLVLELIVLIKCFVGAGNSVLIGEDKHADIAKDGPQVHQAAESAKCAGGCGHKAGDLAFEFG